MSPMSPYKQSREIESIGVREVYIGIYIYIYYRI